MGVKVNASRSESNTATVIVTPNWKKNFPITPLIKATGRKIATTEIVAAIAAKEISLDPAKAASILPLPFS